MRKPGRASLTLTVLLSLCASGARAASLDIGTSYRMRALSYSNLNLGDPPNSRSFITQNAELSAFVKDIQVKLGSFEEQTMDVGLAVRGVGIAGSSTAVQAPFDRIASQYPNTTFTPFIDSAYVKLKQMFGQPIEATFGQQPFSLGSGLLLADDGWGMTGASVVGGLPYWNMKAGGFVFQPRNSQSGGNSLMTYGVSLELPTEGVWQLHYMVEKDRAPAPAAGGIPIMDATRNFAGIRYQMNYGPFVFDGEAAMQRGSANAAGPSPLNPAGSRIAFDGNAQVLRAKWRQIFWKNGGEGIARLLVARGSGDNGGTATTDEAFFPSHGHRIDGLERAGYGDFFGATTYDGFGGHSSYTASGFPANVSGVQTVGLGITTPAYRGVALDFDYFLFQADRNSSGPDRTLGHEWDFRLRYAYHDRFQIQTGIAFFKAGPALSTTWVSARRMSFEVSGRF